MYKRILALLTLEEESIEVLRRAHALADLHGAQLEALHVVEYVPLAGTEDAMLTAPIDLGPELEARAKNRMQELADRVGVSAECCKVVMGDLLGEVQSAVADRDTDLVVVGNRCRSGLAALFEHAQEAVLRKCGCDLLAINLGS